VIGSARRSDARGRQLAEQLQASRAGDDWLDLRGRSHAELQIALGRLPQGCRIKRVIFGAPEYRGRPVDLSYLSFPGETTFEEVSFERMWLDSVSFRDCHFVACDFRYAQISGSHFKNSSFRHCDFYSATFGLATVFLGGAKFGGVSLSGATLTSISGLTRGTFDSDPPALIQERSRDEYRLFLRPTESEREASHTVEDALAEARGDAAAVYRALSRMWASQGETKYARFAYVRSKALERKQIRPWNAHRINGPGKRSRSKQLVDWLARFLTWLWLCISGALRYGDSFWRVGTALVSVTIVPAIVYCFIGGVKQTDGHIVRGFFACWLFSIEQVTASPARHLESTHSWVDLVGSVETVVIVTLLALLGSAFANRLRGS
jgi:hypothetical protein